MGGAGLAAPLSPLLRQPGGPVTAASEHPSPHRDVIRGAIHSTLQLDLSNERRSREAAEGSALDLRQDLALERETVENLEAALRAQEVRCEAAEAVSDQLREGLREERERREAITTRLNSHFLHESRRLEGEFQRQLEAVREELSLQMQIQLESAQGEAMFRAATEAAEAGERDRMKFVTAEVEKKLLEEKLVASEHRIGRLELQLSPFLEATGNYYLGPAGLATPALSTLPR